MTTHYFATIKIPGKYYIMKEKFKLILFLSYLSSHYINTHNSSTAKEIYRSKKSYRKTKKRKKTSYKAHGQCPSESWQRQTLS